MSYTKGPWAVLPEESDKPYIRIRGTLLGRRFKVANVCAPEWDIDESRANARLIAAAPELAEALKEARPCVEEIAEQVDCTAPHKAASIYALLARIDAALAKAGVM